MNPFAWFTSRRRRSAPELAAPEPQIFIADSCLAALRQCIAPALQRRHEGVAFLLGRTDGISATCTTAVRPRAATGPGFFHVSSSEMARVVALAMDFDLQIVGQVHTHPVDAFHSDGDEDGANIRYDGFVSIVLPDYGTRLPDFSGSAIYHHGKAGWSLLDLACLKIVPAGVALDGQ